MASIEEDIKNIIGVLESPQVTISKSDGNTYISTRYELAIGEIAGYVRGKLHELGDEIKRDVDSMYSAEPTDSHPQSKAVGRLILRTVNERIHAAVERLAGKDGDAN